MAEIRAERECRLIDRAIRPGAPVRGDGGEEMGLERLSRRPLVALALTSARQTALAI